MLGGLIASGKLAQLSPAKVLDVLAFTGSGAAGGDSEQVVMSGPSDVKRELDELLADVLATAAEEFEFASAFALREFKLLPGEMGLVVNGRVRACAAT